MEKEQSSSKGKSPEHNIETLREIKNRVKDGKLTVSDLQALERIVQTIENAAKELRAAMVE